MTTKHTPGPWKLSLPDETAVASFDGTEIAAAQGDYDDDDVWPVMAANARLIAAAPEMYEALLMVAAKMDPSGVDEGPMWQRIRAAIAKAEGRL